MARFGRPPLGCRDMIVVVRLLYCLLAMLVLPSVAAAQSLPRSVVLFDQSDPNAPWGTIFRNALWTSLNADPAKPVAVYSELLDLGRSHSKDYEDAIPAYLRKKYREKPIGAVVVHGSLALDIFMRLRAELWPTIPVVFGAVDELTAARWKHSPDVTGAVFQLRLGNSLDAAQALVPNLKKIVLVGDPFERQPFRRHYADELRQLGGRFEVIDLSDLPMAELKMRTASLPDDSAIIYTSIYRDNKGVAYRAVDAVAEIAKTANRPIFCDSEAIIGQGAVGGYVAFAEPVAQATAQLVLRVLNGEAAANLPFATDKFTRPTFDWRRLQQFGISESRLPGGSEVRFRPVTLWDQYRWQMTAIFAVVLLQALMITGLLIERHRRQAAELQAQRRFLEVIHLNRTATAGALSASIAHELNQPLGAILSNAEAAEILLDAETPDIKQVKEILADIRRDDTRADNVIRHLRGLLKKSEIQMQDFDLNEVIRLSSRVLDPEAHKRGVTLKIEQVSGPLPVRADQVHLQQVILNLATNGMDAMAQCEPGSRRMTLETAVNEHREVEVSVSDSGTGIPNDKLKSVFETFYTTKAQGTGLGLSIARTIVETYGGRIWAENRAHGGAVFRFTLPLAKERAA